MTFEQMLKLRSHGPFMMRVNLLRFMKKGMTVTGQHSGTSTNLGLWETLAESLLLIQLREAFQVLQILIPAPAIAAVQVLVTRNNHNWNIRREEPVINVFSVMKCTNQGTHVEDHKPYLLRHVQKQRVNNPILTRLLLQKWKRYHQ